MFNYKDLVFFTKTYPHEKDDPRYVFVLKAIAEGGKFLNEKNYTSVSYKYMLKAAQQATLSIVSEFNDEPNQDRRIAYFVVKSEPYKDEKNSKVFMGFPLYWQNQAICPQIKNFTDNNFAIITSLYVLDDSDLNSKQNSEISIGLSPHLESQFPNKEIIPFILHFLKKAILKNAYGFDKSYASGGYCSIPDDESSRLTVAYDLEVENGKPRSIFIDDLVMSNIIFV